TNYNGPLASDPARLIRPRGYGRSRRRSRRLERGAVRHLALAHIFPQSDEEFSRQCYDRDPALSSALFADAVGKPATQCGPRLVTQPEPGQLDHRRSQARIARLRDSLFSLDAAAEP